MKTKNENARWLVTTILFIMISTVILAQDPPPPPSQMPPDPPMHQRMGNHDDGPSRIFSIPELTDEQKQKIRKIQLQHMEVMTPLRNQMREKDARLNTILSSPPANIKEAEIVADEIGKLHSAILKSQIRHDQELRKLLTPDQQIVFDARPKPFIHKDNPKRKMKERD